VSGPVPPRSTAAGCLPVLGGILLTGLMHAFVSMAVIVVGSAFPPDGSMVVFVFWIFLGVAQWIYLLPAALLSRALGWRGARRTRSIPGAMASSWRPTPAA
jgi:hypothetical protein